MGGAGLGRVQRASHRARPMVFVPTSNPINRPPVGSTARNSSLAVVISGPEMLSAFPSRRPAHSPRRGYNHKHGSCCPAIHRRSEEHTSELQSLMRISYAVFCLKKKRTNARNSYEL